MAVLDRIPNLYYTTLMVDLRDTLNGNNGRVNDTLSSFFSVSANINPWSRRKPIVDIQKAQQSILTTEEMAKQKGANGVVLRRYGVEMLGGAYKPADVYLMVKSNNDCGYIYPLPNSLQVGQPYRLSDFCGYYPAAQQPLETTFADGYKFDYVAYDYTLAGFELGNSDDPNDGQLYRKDIYPTEDVNGNAVGMRRGVYVRLTDGNYDFTVVGGLNFSSDRFVRGALSKLAGKSFEIFEFITNAPESWNSFVSLDDFVASGYYCYALPMPISKCSMQSASGGGVTPTVQVAKVVFSQRPIFFGIDASDYSTVKASFKLSSIGTLYGGGNINLFSCGIYRDAACENVIQRTTFNDFTLGAEAETSTYQVTFTNSTGLSGIYFGIWFRGALQYVGAVLAQANAITVAE